jgi:ABC-type sugar transport system, permease component
MRENHSDRAFRIVATAAVAVFAALCLLPILMAVSVSFTDETALATRGFSLIPAKFSLENYRFILGRKLDVIGRGYLITIIVTSLGTLVSMCVTVPYAYACSIKGFRLRNFLLFFAAFTMLFTGGMLPWYIVVTKYYHLKDSILALILPYGMNVFFMYLVRNFFQTVPQEMFEAATIDGAGKLTTFSRVILPLIKPGLVTVGLFYALQYWNDWYLPLLLLNDSRLYPMQYLLYVVQSNIAFIASGNSVALGEHVVVPTQTARMVMVCIAIGPIALLSGFLQKYFSKGVIVGAIKG